MLRTASSIQDDERVNYSWFAEALTHFDVFLADIDRSFPTQYEILHTRQLRLLDADTSNSPGYR